jgi:tetratricopeptide (TPR) repeat protein
MSNGAISDPRDALEQLEAAGIVAKGETPYFSHALYRDAIYSSMNSRWRATHHRAIGAHLESRRRVDTEPVFELARHCYLGRDWVRVMRYCPRAAEDSERLFAVEQAIMFHRATLEALEMSAEKAKLSEQYYGTATRLASLLMLGGRWDEAERTMLGSAQECGGLGLRGLQARNLTMLGNLLQDRARYDEAWLNLEKAQEIFASLGDRRGQGAVSHSMGIVTARRGDFEGAKSLYRKAIAIGEETGDERLVSKAVNSLGVEMSITGDDASAMECFKRRLEIDERIGDMHGIGVAVGNIGELLRIAGRYDEAMAAFRRKLEIGQKLGDKYTESIALGNMGIVHDTLGQYERAMDCYSRKLRLSEELGDRRSAAVAVSNMGICMYSQGKLCEAEGHYNKAWAMASEIGDKQVLSGCALERIRVRWVRGDIAGALESFDQAIHLCRDSKQKARLCRGLMDHAQILLDTGDVEKARGVVGEACSMASAIQSEIQIAEGEMLKGRVLTFDDAIRAEEAMRELVLRTPNKLVAAEAAYRIYRLTGAERDRVDALERYKGLLDKCYFILHDIRMKELAGEITGPVSLPPPS